MTDDEFIRKYDARESEDIDDYIHRLGTTQTELQDTISFLIRRRELLRDCEIEHLERETEQLVTALADTKRRVLLEELSCFKDVLSLHRRLLEKDDQSRR